MSVHMFRVFVGAGPMSVSDLETRINDWVAANPEWEADSADHTLTERNTAIDGTGETYYAVDVRFREEDTKANLLQKLTDKLKDKTDWYRVGYHVCQHDETNGGPCAWDDSAAWTATGVRVPAGVPTF